MADYKYSYTIDQFPNEEYDTSALDQEIRDSSIVVSLAYLTGYEDSVDIFFRSELGSKDWTTLSGIVAAHDGEPLSENTITPVTIENSPDVAIPDLLAPYNGRLMVTQTSRKSGLAVHWTGRGDDRSNYYKYGNGNYAAYHHKIGDPLSETFYIDFNMVNNETWIHELILTWKGCVLDEVSAEIVTDYCPFVASSGTSYSAYGDLVLPAYPGTGDITPAGDFSQYTSGLVEIPTPSDKGVDPTPCFWDADWSSIEGKFQNIAANPYGTGTYNLFKAESILNKVLNSVVLVGSGFQIFNSSDTDQLGHGMRIKVTYKTHEPAHEWFCSAVMVMHRERVVDMA